MNILLHQQGGSRVEIEKPSLFRGKIEEVSTFINVAQLYLSIKITEEPETTKMVWVLSYVQEEVAKAQKNNLLDKLSKEELGVETIEKLFMKMRNEFGETAEEQKIEQLRTVEQSVQTQD